MKTLRKACKPRDSIFDATRRDVVLDLGDLIDDKDELRNVVLVITDLTVSYQAGTQQIVTALQDLQRESGRAAMDLEPVRMNTDEFYRFFANAFSKRCPAMSKSRRLLRPTRSQSATPARWM